MEISDRLACEIHGIICSDSDSDIEGTDFDEQYYFFKPPPLEYESIKDKIVVFSPEKLLNAYEECLNRTQNNHHENIQNTSNVLLISKKTKQVSPANCEAVKFRDEFNEELEIEFLNPSDVYDDSITENCKISKKTKQVSPANCEAVKFRDEFNEELEIEFLNPSDVYDDSITENCNVNQPKVDVLHKRSSRKKKRKFRPFVLDVSACQDDTETNYEFWLVDRQNLENFLSKYINKKNTEIKSEERGVTANKTFKRHCWNIVSEETDDNLANGKLEFLSTNELKNTPFCTYVPTYRNRETYKINKIKTIALSNNNSGKKKKKFRPFVLNTSECQDDSQIVYEFSLVATANKTFKRHCWNIVSEETDDNLANGKLEFLSTNDFKSKPFRTYAPMYRNRETCKVNKIKSISPTNDNSGKKKKKRFRPLVLNTSDSQDDSQIDYEFSLIERQNVENFYSKYSYTSVKKNTDGKESDEKCITANEAFKKYSWNTINEKANNLVKGTLHLPTNDSKNESFFMYDRVFRNTNRETYKVNKIKTVIQSNDNNSRKKKKKFRPIIDVASNIPAETIIADTKMINMTEKLEENFWGLDKDFQKLNIESTLTKKLEEEFADLKEVYGNNTMSKTKSGFSYLAKRKSNKNKMFVPFLIFEDDDE